MLQPRARVHTRAQRSRQGADETCAARQAPGVLPLEWTRAPGAVRSDRERCGADCRNPTGRYSQRRVCLGGDSRSPWVGYVRFGLRCGMSTLELFRIEPHVCVSCMGRVLSTALPKPDGGTSTIRLYRCAECGIERVGQGPAIICACGFKVSGRPTIGLRCEPNREKSSEFPAEIIAIQA